jgi:hypothetical protein
MTDGRSATILSYHVTKASLPNLAAQHNTSHDTHDTHDTHTHTARHGTTHTTCRGQHSQRGWARLLELPGSVRVGRNLAHPRLHRLQHADHVLHGLQNATRHTTHDTTHDTTTAHQQVEFSRQ